MDSYYDAMKCALSTPKGPTPKQQYWYSTCTSNISFTYCENISKK